ncbi:MAG TPA: glycosyltransferase family 39 protein, partial [Myxococcales bacterium]
MNRNARWAVLGLLLLAAAAIRLRLLQVPLERDEGEYAYGASLLLGGRAPFSSMYSMKLPGTQFAYASFLALFGHSGAAIRFGLLLVNAATTLLVFALGRRLMSCGGAIAAATAFAALSLSPAFLGIFAHATHFVILFAVAGLLVLHIALESRRRRHFAAAGALLGAAVLMKQAGLVFPALAICWWGWECRSGRRRWAAEGASLCAGIAAPLLVTAAAVALAGTLPAMWFWTVTYAREYATALPLAEALRNLGRAVARFGPATLPVLLLAGAGLVVALARRSALLPLLLLCSLAGAAVGFYFRRHYFILAIPAAALLAGCAFDALAARARSAAVTVVCAACAWTLVAERDVLFALPPAAVSRAIYGENPFPEAVEIARYLREHTGERDRVAVLGSEPEIPFYARRLSATGHVYMYSLMEAHPFASAMQEQAIREIESARPPYIVWVLAQSSWLPHPGAPKLLPEWARRYVAQGYRVVGSATVVDLTHTRYVWGAAAESEP